MKESEYFKKAFQDADYRREKIMELRYQAKYTLGFLIFGVVLLVAMTLARGLGEGLWWEGLTGMFPSVIIMAWVHSNTKTRLAALEVMDGKQPESVQPTAAAGA
ncbi:MAG: hypothetical protein PSV13_08705 [Lacunisphaera sp.]|nr:hypothetical protein [Lacunisphaera sp.]